MDQPGRVFDVTVALERSSCAPALLPTGRFQVRWVKAPAAPDHNGVTADCNLTLPSTASPWVRLGVLTVGSNTTGTAGSTTIKLADGLPAATMRGHGNICVTKRWPDRRSHGLHNLDLMAAPDVSAAIRAHKQA